MALGKSIYYLKMIPNQDMCTHAQNLVVCTAVAIASNADNDISGNHPVVTALKTTQQNTSVTGYIKSMNYCLHNFYFIEVNYWRNRAKN
jgi:hypothetical protein